MSAAIAEPINLPTPLEGRFSTPPSPDELRPTKATVDLVQSQVQALLQATPSYHELSDAERDRLNDRLVYIASYAAECMRDVCWQSKRLGQTPVVRKTNAMAGPIAQAQEEGWKPKAAGQIARITQEQLKAIAFPTFVADLIRGTFDAIVRTSIQQMESFIQMVENVSKTVDQFMADNISDNQARDWLAARYPEHIRIDKDKAVPVDGSDDRPMPDFRRDLNLPDSISGVDESTIDETLVPAARRRLAESRLQLLSTLVLMGVNRIVVTGGKIRATMGFHIDTTDRLHEEHASDFDFRTATAGSFGYGPWSVSASLSVSYVTSTRQQSDSEINVDTDLTGEVELHFKSDYFPVERFANSGVLGTIQNNTAVPEANRPPQTPTDSLATEAPATGGDVGRYTSSRSRRTPKKEPILPPIGTRSPDSNVPVEPTAPKVKRWQAAPGWEDATPPEGAIVSKPKEEKKEDEKKEEDKKEPAKEEQKVEAKKTKGPDKKKEPAKKQEPKKEEAKNGEATGEAESLSWSPLR